MSTEKTVSEILEQRRQKARLERDTRINQLYKDYPDLAKMARKKKDLGQKMILEAMKQKDTDSIREELRKVEEEEEGVLKELGIDEDFFEPDYTCPYCQDEGFVDGKPCSCRKQIQIELNYGMSQTVQNIKEENFENFDLELFRKNRQADEPISPYENMKELYYDMKDQYVPYFSTNSPNLYFYGPTGTGKTYLVNSIAKAVLDRGFTVLYQTANQLLDFLVSYSFMFEQDRKENKEKYDFIYEVDLLIIDDLGTEYINDKLVSVLFELINGRLISRKPIIISSNIKIEELADVYDQRIASRIAGEYHIYPLFGNDLRWRL